MQWLYVGAVAAGLGASIATGQGVAAAAPSDDPDTAQSASSATEATGTETDTASAAKDVGAQSPRGFASESAVSGSSVHQPVSKVSTQQSLSATKDSDSAADPADDPAYEESAQTGLTADTTTATTFVTDTTDDVRIAAPTPGSTSTGTAKDADSSDRSDTFATNKTVHAPEKPDHSQVSAAQANPSEEIGASAKVQSAPVVSPDPSASHET